MRSFFKFFACTLALTPLLANAVSEDECRTRYDQDLAQLNNPQVYSPRNAGQQAQQALALCLSSAAAAPPGREVGQAPVRARALSEHYNANPPTAAEPRYTPVPQELGGRDAYGRGPMGAPPPEYPSVKKLHLAYALSTGLGQKLNSQKGAALFKEANPTDEKIQRAAEAGDTVALGFIGEEHVSGLRIARDTEKGKSMLSQAAEKGNVRAMYQLCGMSLAGTSGPVNHVAAANWCEAAAKKGYSVAQLTYAGMLWTGQGTPKNLEKAIEYYEKAANQGDIESHYSLGNIYVAGAEGTEFNIERGAKHLEIAAAADHEKAGVLLNRVRTAVSEAVAGAVATTGLPLIKNKADFIRYFGECGKDTSPPGLPPSGAAYVCVARNASKCAQDAGVHRCQQARFGFNKEDSLRWATLTLGGSSAPSKIFEDYAKAFGRIKPKASQAGRYMQADFAWQRPGFKVELNTFNVITNLKDNENFVLIWVVPTL